MKENTKAIDLLKKEMEHFECIASNSRKDSSGTDFPEKNNNLHQRIRDLEHQIRKLGKKGEDSERGEHIVGFGKLQRPKSEGHC